MKKENRILHMPISNVSIERMDLEQSEDSSLMVGLYDVK